MDLLLGFYQHEGHESHQHNFHDLVPLDQRLFRHQSRGRGHIHPQHENDKRPRHRSKGQVFWIPG